MHHLPAKWLAQSCALFLAFFAATDLYAFPLYQTRGALGSEVDMQGYFSKRTKLGELQFGQSLTLPLILDYSSRLRSSSPYAGEGWRLCLLEASAVEQSEHVMAVTMLGGKVLYFRKDKENPSVYRHRGGEWTGEKRGPDFTISSPQGNTIEYSQGLISKIVTSDGRHIEWKRRGGVVYEIAERGQKAALTLTTSSSEGLKEMSLNGKKFAFERDLISQGLKKIVWPSGKESVFNRKQDEKGSPQLEWKHPNGPQHKATWDIANGRIRSLDDWQYKVEIPYLSNKDPKAPQVENTLQWPKLERLNLLTKKKEGYWYNTTTGITTILNADGSTIKEYEFLTPGPLFRKMRKIERIQNGKTDIVMRNVFDESGILLKSIHFDPISKITSEDRFDPEGRPLETLINGQLTSRYNYDPKGKLVSTDTIPVAINAHKQTAESMISETVTTLSQSLEKIP